MLDLALKNVLTEGALKMPEYFAGEDPFGMDGSTGSAKSNKSVSWLPAGLLTVALALGLIVFTIVYRGHMQTWDENKFLTVTLDGKATVRVEDSLSFQQGALMMAPPAGQRGECYWLPKWVRYGNGNAVPLKSVSLIRNNGESAGYYDL
jgi:hypothetical protein